MKKIRWFRLKDMKCARCAKDIRHDPVRDSMECIDQVKCGFFITMDRFNKIVTGMYTRGSSRGPEDNASLLNNFGHERVTEDFSDSPVLQ